MRIDTVGIAAAARASLGSGDVSVWKVGAIIEAVALRDTASGALWLDTPYGRLAASLQSRTGAGPANGEALRLRVVRNSPTLEFEAIAVGAPGGNPEGEGGDPIVNGLLRYLPRQASPMLLLSNLGWLARGGSRVSALPPEVMAAANRLWSAIADSATLRDPQRLAAAIARSGPLLETTLANAPANEIALQGDIKGLLLVFRQVLADALGGSKTGNGPLDTSGAATPPLAHGTLTPLSKMPATLTVFDSVNDRMAELARQTDGSLARITVTQLANASTNGVHAAWLVEIPVRHEDRPDFVRLKFERERSSAATVRGSDAWSVEVALDLGVSGPMHARISYEQRQINVHLRADSAALVDLFRQRSAELAQSLRSAGLNVGGITCRIGMPAAHEGMTARVLLDVRA